MREGMVPVAAGLGAGLLLAIGLTRLLTSLLFEISPFDPATFLSAPSVLAAVAALSYYLPARKAGRLAPAEALRYE
jgi:ABC-type antimicrobial peptide transport system permease subunit